MPAELWHITAGSAVKLLYFIACKVFWVAQADKPSEAADNYADSKMSRKVIGKVLSKGAR